MIEAAAGSMACLLLNRMFGIRILVLKRILQEPIVAMARG
jgi:hypothetical protein